MSLRYNLYQSYKRKAKRKKEFGWFDVKEKETTCRENCEKIVTALRKTENPPAKATLKEYGYSV